MRISQETPDMLVIEKRTSLWYFIGIMLALVGVIILLVSIISFTIKFDSGIILPAVLILIGFVIVAFNKQISLTFDKKANRISYIEERMIGSASEYRQLNKIKSIELREKAGKKQKIPYVINLVFKDLPELEIQPAKLSFSFLFFTLANIKNTEETANRISGFLGIKLVKKIPGLPEEKPKEETPAKTPRFPVLPATPAKIEISKEKLKELVEEKEEAKPKEKEKPVKLDEEEKTEF